jgi:hypothetical protein
MATGLTCHPWFSTREAWSAPEVRRRDRRDDRSMTFIWFVIWLIANNVGGHEPLLGDPVNAWAATLILAIALDLGGSHARGRASS